MVNGEVHHHKTAGIPHLVGKVPHSLALFRVKAHVVAGAVTGDKVKPKGVRAVFLRHLQRVDAVAQGLGHFSSLVIPDQTVDQHRVEGNVLHLLTAGKDHPGDPEEDDVIAGNHDGGGVIEVQVRRLLRPPQGGEGPQGGGEPGVQHVRVTGQTGAAALFAPGGILPADVDVAALVAVPGGDLMAPPQLAGDAPVVDIFHPVRVGFGKPFGDEFHLAVPHHPQGLLRQGLHLHKPLGGDQRLHIVVAAVAGADVVVVGLGLHQIALLLQVADNGLAARIAVQPGVGAAVFVDSAVIPDNADDLQIVPLAHLKVVWVVGGGHLHRTGSEADLTVLVPHNGNLPVHNGQYAGLSNQVLKPLVLRVHGYAGVAHHGFRPGGGDYQVAGAVGQRIADMPQVTGLVLILHLRIGEGGDAVGAPVDNAAALVDESLAIQLAKGLPHGLGATLVHGEAGTAPVTGDAHLLLLGHDASAVLLFPLPHPLEELFTAQVVAGQALLRPQLLLHLDLGGDTGVVGAGNPQRGVALHPLKAGEDILQRAVQGMAHVELACYIGRRHHNGKWLFGPVRVAVKTVPLLPHLIDAALHLLRLVHLGKFSSHTLSSPVFIKIFCFAEYGSRRKKKTPRAFRLRADQHPRYHLNSGDHPALTGAFTPHPDNGGPPPPLTRSFSRDAPGRLLRRPPGSLHRPLPLFASACRVLLPIHAISL